MTNNFEKKRTDYTEGSILSAILKMGLPSMFGFLTGNIYRLIDMWWVSRLPDGEEAVAAITFFGTIFWLFFSFNQLVGPGSVAIISRRYGEKLFDDTEKAIKETLVLKLFFGVILGVVGIFLLPTALKLVGAEGKALEMGIEYGLIMFIGLASAYAMFSIFTAMRGVANPQLAMVLMLGSNILNMLLDPIFIFGYWGFPAMGIKGAAVASAISFTLTLIVGLYLFYAGHTNVKLHLKGAKSMTVSSMWTMLKIGVPSWLGDLSFSSARLIITPIVATFGTSVVAAYGVGNLITEIGIMILVGINLGVSSLIGHNVGSGKIERAKSTANQSILLGIGIMLLLGILVAALAPIIMNMFFESAETINAGITLLRIFAIGFPFIGAWIMVAAVHLGVGLNTPTMVVNIINAWILEIIPIYFFTQHFGLGVEFIWWTMSLASVICAFGFYFYYKRGRWLKHNV